MKLEKSHVSWLVALAVVVVAVTLRFSLQTLPLLLIVLVCPVMMFLMVRGMHHGAGDQSHGHGDDHTEHAGDHPWMSGRGDERYGRDGTTNGGEGGGDVQAQ